jgi:hypothetical protein
LQSKEHHLKSLNDISYLDHHHRLSAIADRDARLSRVNTYIAPVQATSLDIKTLARCVERWQRIGWLHLTAELSGPPFTLCACCANRAGTGHVIAQDHVETSLVHSHSAAHLTRCV